MFVCVGGVLSFAGFGGIESTACALGGDTAVETVGVWDAVTDDGIRGMVVCLLGGGLYYSSGLGSPCSSCSSLVGWELGLLWLSGGGCATSFTCRSASMVF